MGVIYKILKQRRQQHSMDLSTGTGTSTKSKVQAAIKQRQRLHQLQQQVHKPPEQPPVAATAVALDEEPAEEQLQQLCRFLAENAARKKRLKLNYDYVNSTLPAEEEEEEEEQQQREPAAAAAAAHAVEAKLLMQQLSSCVSTTQSAGPGAPRDSILLKIRHQILERKRLRQRQLAELMQQQLVVWRPW